MIGIEKNKNQYTVACLKKQKTFIYVVDIIDVAVLNPNEIDHDNYSFFW